MIRLYAPVVLIFLFSLSAMGQPYGNEWINFSTNQPYSNQQYFKVSVWRDGIYRITPGDLNAAGFPSTFNPKQFQLFYQGQEQFIYVEGEADGVFDPGDYIEFYGLKNDGSFDTRLYKNPDHQVNKNYSLITDTAAYFLTLNANPFIINRRMGVETDVNFLGYTPIPYFIRESFADYAAVYNNIKIQELSDSEYDEGEGFYSVAMLNSPINFFLPVPNVSLDPSAPLAIASSTTMGNNSPGEPHSLTLDVNGSSSTSNFTSYELSKFVITLASNNALVGGTAIFNFTPGSSPANANRNVVSFTKMVYPHSLSYSGEGGNFRKLLVPGNLAPGKSFLDITGLLMGSPKLYMISNDTLKRVSVMGSGTNMQALVPTFGTDKLCFITDSVYTSASGLMVIAPINTDPARFARFVNFQYISNGDYLIITHPSLMAKADDYRVYRANTGYTPLLTDVEELYNQFGYGISKHPLSIKNFCDFALDTFQIKPKFLFLIGKSVNSTKCRFSTINWNKNMVPSFGAPPADLLFTAGLNGDTIPRPQIAVGRISAQNDADIQAYLEKIMIHEVQLQQCPQDWMKQILHFGGGSNIYQQQEIKTILGKYESVIEDTLMAANVTSFYKTSPDPIQINLSQYLQALIDTGTTIMTFVAHASGSTFDINTDVPQNYHNQDRYPIIIANSCFVGDIHDPLRRVAEDFVLLPDKGAIGFLAEPDVGFLPELSVYTENLYKQIARTNYGGTLGKSMRNAIDSIYADPTTFTNQYTYLFFKSVCSSMTLSGDPALVLNSWGNPEYSISQSGIYFTPSPVTSDIDSFNVSVVVKNLGRAENISTVLHMVRHFPDNSEIALDTILGYIVYKDTITFRLPVDQSRGVGPNTFDFFVDYFSAINECNEVDNIVDSVQLLIQSSDIVPVYPAEFAIVPNNTTKLKASTVNPFSPLKPYQFQIDTVDAFNSPFKISTTINSSGGVVQWQVPITLQPDLVYYWRVARDSMPGDTIHPPWKESSFIHKPGLTGWSQAHYSQFKKDEFINLNYSNSYDTTFSFVTSVSSLTVHNYYQPNNTYNPDYEINNVVQDYQMCFGVPSMHIAVIDSVTLKPWATDIHYYGNVNTYDASTGASFCNRGRPEYYFIFRMTDPASRAEMIDMLVNDIPNGNYVIAYTVFSGKFSQWSQADKDVFTNMGSDSINFLDDSQPYIFFAKKGYPATADEAVGDSIITAISLIEQLGGNWSKGYVSSVPIGPAVNWTSLHWEQAPLEALPGVDSVAVDIIGIQPNGLEVPIAGFQGIQVGTPDLNINSIDAIQYPRLKLQAYLQDEQLFTPPQLKRWQIYYDEIPELAINPNKYFQLNKDTLAEGEEIRMSVAIENIGNVIADSLLTDFYLYDNNHVRHNLTSPRYKITNPGDTIIASVNFSTGGYSGLNSLWIEANPHVDQPEQYHFNNFGQIDFRVNRDITNPILDVTFDGVHILNGDIISGKPEILIRLKDENKYIALKDTSNWQIFLRNPLGVQKRLYFESTGCSGNGTQFLKWCPASLPHNAFLIQHKPVFAMDGIYELWVQASDESGNISGDNSYRITFEVINKSTITEVVNYPNPFSTSTRFVFTLTGSEVPQDFKIQIMTVTGKIVREILQDEIGPIRIGRNITEFAWNGKDEFGDQLANGVYLYRVTSRLNGNSIEKRETEADKFFTKGWGKMYLMR